MVTIALDPLQPSTDVGSLLVDGLDVELVLLPGCDLVPPGNPPAAVGIEVLEDAGTAVGRLTDLELVQVAIMPLA